jgi:Tfp pilus assembly protein PilF
MNRLIRAAFLSVLLTATAGATEINSLVEAGNKFWSEGQLQQAESTFREAIRLDPEAALPHARLAGLLMSQQRNDEARSEYQQAIMNDPEDPALFLALAIVYLHEKSYSMAQSMVDAALELDPDMENALKLQLYVTSKMARLEAADTGSSDTPVAIPQDVIHGSTPTGAANAPH